MGDLGNKVLEKIKAEKIEPKPRWQFLLKDYFIWLVFITAVVVGGIAFCVILHIFSANDWDIYQNLGRSRLTHVLLSFPYVWLVLLGLFLALAHYNYRHTKRGYCCGTYWIVVLSVAGSLVLGIILHLGGTGKIMENTLFARIPLYQKVSCCHYRKDIWTQPEKGLLGGRILNVKNDFEFDLEDFGGFIWVVERNSQTILRNPVVIIKNENVKLIGEKKGEKRFWAKEIRMWEKEKR